MRSLLIVDDDADGREVLCAFLERHGYRVTCVSNGRDALSALVADLPDLMILDLLMPELDGPGLLEIVRSYLRLQSLPVIVLTGVPDSLLAEKARRLKVNATLTKGTSGPEQVLAAVRRELAVDAD